MRAPPAAPRPTAFKNARLQHAAFEGRAGAVAHWLSRGADANDKCPLGITPAMRAAYGAHGDCLRLLGDAGADFGAKDHKGRSACDYATARRAPHWGACARWLAAATQAQAQKNELAALAPAGTPSSMATSNTRMSRPRI